MAGHGGAWKVAYADFVTAMMAFFLVMWLISQDQKVKESIAHYFAGPVGINLLGDSTRAPTAGGLFYSQVEGPVPGKTTRTAGRSIGSNPEQLTEESEAMVVTEWIEHDRGLNNHWMKEIQKQLKAAQQSEDVRSGNITAEDAIRKNLARQMRSEISADAVRNTDGMCRDILLTTLSKLDWQAVADECLLNSRKEQ